MTSESAMTKQSPTVLVTRPSPDAENMARAIAGRGWTPVLAPLLKIKRRDIGVSIGAFAAVAFTSSNGVRAAPRPGGWDGVTFCVGATTAAAAARAGWPQIIEAKGDVGSLAHVVADGMRRRSLAGPVLHLSGADAAGDLAGALRAAGLICERRVAYEATAATALPPQASVFLAAPGEGAWATFFSARTAEIFFRLAPITALQRIGAAALSAAVAERLARARWRDLVVADAPAERSLLDAIGRAAAGRDAIRP